MIYFPCVYRTIPLSYDDSMSYYSQLLAINKILSEIGDEITKIETTLNGIDAEIAKEVEKEFQKFQKTVEKELADLKSEIDADVEKEIDSVKTDFTNLVKLVEQKIQEQDDKIGQFKIEIDGKIYNVQKDLADVLNGLGAIYEYIDKSNAVYWERVKEYCDELYTSRKIYYVKNPVTGKVDEVNSTLEMLYRVSVNALTCDEYASLKLTADEYAKLQLTCFEFLRKLREYYNLRSYEKTVSIWNPYSGRFENAIETVKQLVKFHENNSLTADEYAGLNLTANEYAEKQITAYDYYVNGKILLTM